MPAANRFAYVLFNPILLPPSEHISILQNAGLVAQNGSCRVTRNRSLGGFLEPDYIRQIQNLIGQCGTFFRIDNHFRENVIEIATGERGSPLGEGIEDLRRAERAD